MASAGGNHTGDRFRGHLLPEESLAVKKLADALPASPLPPISVPTRREPPSAPALERTGAGLPLERRLADLLASVVQKHDVPLDANFFEDLGTDSLVMARFCARVRKQSDLPAVSMKDIYQHPTITALAGALAPPEPVPAAVRDRLVEVLTGVLGVDRVPVDADFFDGGCGWRFSPRRHRRD